MTNWGIRGFCAAVTAFAAGAAFGQSFNLDLGTSIQGGAGFGPPSAAHGAAAVQPGFWNNLTGATVTTLALNNLGGAATAVTFTRSSALGGDFAFDNALTTGDRALLIDDGQDLSATTGNVIYRFNNLSAGLYEVYTYAVAPDVPTSDFTSVFVVNSTSTNPQIVGGAMPSQAVGYVLGQTHALHVVSLTAPGFIEIRADGQAGSFGTVNGFQLRLVPEPASLALLAIGGLFAIRRR